MKRYKVKWDFCAVVSAESEEEAIEKAEEEWNDNNFSQLIAEEVNKKQMTT